MSYRTIMLALAAVCLAGGAVAFAQEEVLTPEWFITGWTDSTVYRHDPGTGETEQRVTSGRAGLENPRTTILGPDDLLYVTSIGTHEVLRYRRDSGRLVDRFIPARSGGLQFPTDLLFDAAGHLLVASFGTDSVLRFDAEGIYVGIAVASGSGGLAGPEDMILGPDGSLWVVGAASASILSYDLETGAFLGVVVAPGTGAIRTPHSLTIGKDRNVYVPTFGGHDVHRFRPTGASRGTFVASGSAGLENPHGAVFDENRALLTASFATDEVLRFDRRGGPAGRLVGPDDGVVAPIDMLPLNKPAACEMITRTISRCRKGRLLLKVRADAAQGSVLVIDNGGVPQLVKVNRKGRAKAVWRKQSGSHILSLPGCPYREIIDCG